MTRLAATATAAAAITPARSTTRRISCFLSRKDDVAHEGDRLRRRLSAQGDRLNPAIRSAYLT